MSPGKIRAVVWPPSRLLQAAYGAQRRVSRVTDRFVGGARGLHSKPVAGLPRAACAFLRVGDGRTLHVQALLPVLPDLEPDGADLLFIRNRRVLRCPARLRRDTTRFWAEAMALLGEGPDEIPLSRGTWLLGLAVVDRGTERRFALHGGGVDNPTDSPIVPAPPHPVSGRRYEPGQGSRGLAQIVVSEPRARAEVVRLTTIGSTARIQARIVGVRTLERPAVVFTPRGSGADRVVPIEPVDGRFEFVVPVAELASGRSGTEVIWEPWVRTSPARMIRLGRFLHDLREPRTVLRASQVVIPIDDGQFVGYRPYYTKAGNLAVSCLRFTRFTGTQT